MRIIMRTVAGSKVEKSPLTSARRSSGSPSWPLPRASTALKSGKSDASEALLDGCCWGAGRLAGWALL